MPIPLLDLHGPKPRPMQPLIADLGLARGRVHEVCGVARRSFACFLMEQSTGPVVWIAPHWRTERLYPDGLREFVDPARLTLAHARREVDILWAMEECLRSGVVPLVVADLTEIPDLTPVRRLQLAAEAGAAAGRPAPLGLLMTPEMGGAAGVESRWRLNPTLWEGANLLSHHPLTRGWRLDRLRARIDPPATWSVSRDTSHKMTLGPMQPPEADRRGGAMPPNDWRVPTT